MRLPFHECPWKGNIVIRNRYGTQFKKLRFLYLSYRRLNSGYSHQASKELSTGPPKSSFLYLDLIMIKILLRNKVQKAGKSPFKKQASPNIQLV